MSTPDVIVQLQESPTQLRFLVAIANLAFVGGVFAAPDDTALTAPGMNGTATATGPPDAYQVAYAANVWIGDSFVNITNAGSRGAYDITQTSFSPAGGICANIYVFDPSEEMVACCACYVSPDSLRPLSAQNDLVINTFTGTKPAGILIKLVASEPLGSKGSNSDCNAALVTAPTLTSGMRAWSTSFHQNTATGDNVVTENAFQNAILSKSELQKLTSFCGYIQSIGSNYGICKSCRIGTSLAISIQ